MTATLSPRIAELQAIPRIYRRLMSSVILKRIAARAARIGRSFPRGHRREELLQDAMAHAWVWLQDCTLDYWADEMISPKEAAILAAYRGADRAFDGRPLPGEDFSTRPLPTTLEQDLEERSESRALPFAMDDIPDRCRPLAVHIAQGGKCAEWADLYGKSVRWAYQEREILAVIVKALCLSSKECNANF